MLVSVILSSVADMTNEHRFSGLKPYNIYTVLEVRSPQTVLVGPNQGSGRFMLLLGPQGKIYYWNFFFKKSFQLLEAPRDSHELP